MTSTKYLLASLLLATACGGDSNTTDSQDDSPAIDAASGSIDAANGSIDAGGAADAASGTPDAGNPDAALPTAIPTIFAFGDISTNNINDIGTFLQDDPEPPTVTNLPIAGSVVDFDVSADANVIAYCDDANVISVIADAGAPAVLVPAQAGAVVSDVAISPDGKQVAFRADRELAGMFDVYVADSFGTVTKVSPARAPDDIALDASPVMVWTADSSTLLFGGRFSDANKNELRAYVVGGEAASITLIGAADINAPVVAGTPTPGFILPPVVRGTTGQVIVQARLTADGKRLLYKVNLDGTGLDLVGNALIDRGGNNLADVWSYAVSADGTTIAFAADGIVATAFEIYKMKGDDSAAPTRLTGGNVPVDREVHRFDPMVFSPDGTQLAFHADYGATLDKFEPYVMNIADGAMHRLAVIGTAANAEQDSTGVIAWSHDGSKLYVIGDHRANNDAELYSLATADTDGVPSLLVDPPASGDVFTFVAR